MIDEQLLIRTLLTEQVKVLGYLQSMLRKPEVAEDIFQDLCVLAMEQKGKIQSEAHMKNWMRTTARFLALNVLRKKKEEHLAIDIAALDAMEACWSQLDQWDGSQYSDSVRHCVKELSQTNQRLLAKRFVEGYDYTQLASEYQRSVASLYVTFSRIYATLGRCISARMPVAAEVNHG
jgi:RNA polymerase sigma factor (sigma-70 family)